MKPQSIIVNLRGTSGSGKTTAVRNILRRWPTTPAELAPNRRKETPLVYKTKIPGKLPLFVFGSYENVCGGCDGISDYAEVVPALLQKYSPLGHILFEGMLISGSYGKIGLALAEQERKGCEVYFSVLDTPLEVCIKRVQARRDARGDTRPYNPKNLIDKHKSSERILLKIAGEYHHNTSHIDHTHPATDVMKLFGVPYAIKR